MFSHMTIGANDMAKARTFYDAVFGAMGGAPGIEDDAGRLIYMCNDGLFLVTKPIDGNPATRGNGSTVGFNMASPEQAKAWHDAGVANGGTSCEDPPGVREGSYGKLYLAYLRDPDGNKLCALHRLG